MRPVRTGRFSAAWQRLRDYVAIESKRSDLWVLWGLSTMAVSIVTVGVVFPGLVASVAMLLPIFLSSMWLSPRRIPWFVISCLAGACVLLAMQETVGPRTVLRILVTFGIALIILNSSLRRSRLGVSSPRSESVFVDLRDRITSHGRIPELGPDWSVESVWRSAEGTAFAGDFVVASVHEDVCDIVVVDVSGKGVDAGSRALLLSGALGGVLSAVTPDCFLREANTYLMRQNWAEGFATAIHLNIDLATGLFQIRKAGHPPAIWLRSGSGGWQTLESDGPILGLLHDVEYEAIEGKLERGDALMLYTDGMVETSRRDIDSGIDWLAGRGVRLFQTGFEGGAQQVIDGVGIKDDDRALVIVHRK